MIQTRSSTSSSQWQMASPRGHSLLAERSESSRARASLIFEVFPTRSSVCSLSPVCYLMNLRAFHKREGRFFLSSTLPHLILLQMIKEKTIERYPQDLPRKRLSYSVVLTLSWHSWMNLREQIIGSAISKKLAQYHSRSTRSCRVCRVVYLYSSGLAFEDLSNTRRPGTQHNNKSNTRSRFLNATYVGVVGSH